MEEPCKGCKKKNIPPMTPEAAHEKTVKLSEGWMLIDEGRMLAKQFSFLDFKRTMVFVNKVAEAAEELNHHPDMTVSYGSVGIELMTHGAQGLTENDFILAAKIDTIAP